VIPLGYKSFSGLVETGFRHVVRNQPPRTEWRKGAHPPFLLPTGPSETCNNG